MIIKDDAFVTAVTAHNMRKVASDEEVSAALAGTDLDVSFRVYAKDGSMYWPTALANALCRNPELANGNRTAMAELITKELNMSKPFVESRLSRALSGIAHKKVKGILVDAGYDGANAKTGIAIRDIVRRGRADTSGVTRTNTTRFAIDGVWLETVFYPYEKFSTYETGSPWYELGVRFADDLIQLKTVLAMRSIGISEFIGLDEAAHKTATGEQLARRKAMTQKAYANAA